MAHNTNAVRDQNKRLEERLKRPVRTPRVAGGLGSALRGRLRGVNARTPRR